uniref:Conserved plasma membrane protein n=1 Tax=Anisakis simplex TaxID=6269 RepID=A0A0M3JFC8_ANISI
LHNLPYIIGGTLMMLTVALLLVAIFGAVYFRRKQRQSERERTSKSSCRRSTSESRSQFSEEQAHLCGIEWCNDELESVKYEKAVNWVKLKKCSSNLEPQIRLRLQKIKRLQEHEKSPRVQAAHRASLYSIEASLSKKADRDAIKHRKQFKSYYEVNR